MTRMSRQTRIMYGAVVALLLPAGAHANTGIPVFALAWPLQWLAIIPIVAIECEVFRRGLDIRLRESVWPIARANLRSTLLGIPMAWMLVMVFQVSAGGVLSFFPDSAEIRNLLDVLGFSLSATTGSANDWHAFGAYVMLAVPFCAISVWMERRTLRQDFAAHGVKVIDALTRKANVLSYVALCSMALAYTLAV